MKHVLKDAVGWGFALWLIGYVLGIALFAVVPAAMIGWVIMPIGVMLTAWVLFTRVHANSLAYFLTLSLAWTAIAVALDYLFIVKLFSPGDGYYKLDVYLYYAFTFLLPLAAGAIKLSRPQAALSH
ncbi:MAG TPA: hypothetical protein VF937_07580 [Chloroflexota bacterium]